MGLLPLKEKLRFNKAVSVFKAYRNLAPPYLKQLFISSMPRHETRATSPLITLPKPRIDLFKTSSSFPGASLWNAIPTQIKSSETRVSWLVNGPEESPSTQDAIETTSSFVFRTFCVCSRSADALCTASRGKRIQLFKLRRLITSETMFLLFFMKQ